MSSKDISRKEIAKQFELPERSSKIASLLKGTIEYCICRSTDSTSFMIACDSCEEWYHGECMNITERESRSIKTYFCPPCMERNPKLEIVYKKPKVSSSTQRSKQKENKQGKDSSKKSSAGKGKKSDDGPGCSKDLFGRKVEVSGRKEYGRCGSCSGCLTVVDCSRCDICTGKSGSQRGCRKRQCTSKDDSDSDYELEDKKPSLQILSGKQLSEFSEDEEDNWTPTVSKSASKPKASTTPGKRGKKQQKKSSSKIKERARRAKEKARAQKETPSSPEPTKGMSDVGSDEEEERQCYGLDCVNAARMYSKYCSEECCIKLATERLYRILPGRIQEWNLTPPVAEERNRKELEDVRRKQIETRNKIGELERKRADLDRYVENIQQLKVDPDADDGEPEEEGLIHCVTCGLEVPIKTCLKHMERCYNKHESQTSFGSIYKTRLEGIPIFCDFYNPNNETYCKRLAVLCPEHSKEPKIGDTEMCGCPIATKTLSESCLPQLLAGKYCHASKKKCNKHFTWEKLRRAEIDMERVRNWLKLDELMDQERQLRTAMANRGGVMGLLLHSTFDHDLRSRIQSQLTEQQKRAHERAMEDSHQGMSERAEEDISEEEDFVDV